MNSRHPVRVYADGGARGNPGPAAAGVVIEQDGKTLEESSVFLGKKTNNQAEYAALLSGLDKARKHTEDLVVVTMDSELVINQMTGKYKIKSPELKKLAHQANGLLGEFREVRFEHTRREGNQRADTLVNAELDRNS